MPNSKQLCRIAAQISDFSVFAMLLWLCLPDMWTKPITIDVLPMQCVFTQVLASSLILESLLKRNRRSGFVLLWTIGVLFTIGRGLSVQDRNHWDSKFFVTDLWTLESLLVGFVWARRRDISQWGSVVTRVAKFLIPIAVFTM